MTKEDFHAALRDFETRYPGKLRIMKSPADVQRYMGLQDMSDIETQTFPNFSDRIVPFISSSLRRGKDVVLGAAGTNSVLVIVGGSILKTSR